MANGRKKVQYFSDFTGGLNWQNEQQDLALNESPDMLDVDIQPHGGFVVRNGVTHAATSGFLDVDAYGTPDGAYILGQVSLGTEYLLGVSYDGSMWKWDGATFSNISTTPQFTDSTAEFMRMATYNNKVYLVNCWESGVLKSKRLTGATLGVVTTLTNTFNNDYTAPDSGDVPLSRVIANHQGHMFVADTTESGTRYRHRVRWSHPLQPEDWASADYFDIDNYDSTDQIVALQPFRDRLLVFKRRSVYAIFGYDRDSFVVERIAGAAGTTGQEAVAVSEQNVFWWSPDGNVYAYNGSQVAQIGDNISLIHKNNRMTASGLANLCWADDRLWVALRSSATAASWLLVFDPRLGKKGAWTEYSYAATSMAFYKSTSGVNTLYGLIAGNSVLYKFNVPTQEQDEFSDGVLTPISGAYFKTAWFSGGDTALKKNFKRLHMTAASNTAGDLLADVFVDFSRSANRTLTMPFDITGANMVWGTGLWGTDMWGGEDSAYEFDRLQSAGRGHSIQLKFRFPTSTGRWWVDSFTLPYVEKFYR